MQDGALQDVDIVFCEIVIATENISLSNIKLNGKKFIATRQRFQLVQ